MKIFNELKKLGYKHYTEHTIKELDDLPLNSEERIMEQALVLRWFREKYGLVFYVEHCGQDWFGYVIQEYEDYDGERFWYKKNESETREISPEEAELECLIKLIEIVKEQK